MKALITGVEYDKEITSKKGDPLHIFKISYDGKQATYFCQSKEQFEPREN